MDKVRSVVPVDNDRSSQKPAQTHPLNEFLTLLFSAWAALLLYYLPYLFLCAPQNDDQSWYMYAAQRMMSGAQLYGPQLIQANPPLIIWFSAIPVYLAHLLHLDSYLVLELIVFVLICASTAWCGRILYRTGVFRSPALFCFGLASVLSAEIFLSGGVLGQREHLLVIFILPYLLSAACKGRANLPFLELCALGIAAGIAVCFKPQHVIILIVLELLLTVWTRSLRRLVSPDFLCAVLAIFSYIASVRLAAPLYLSTTVPLLRETYWAYGDFSTWSLIRTGYLYDLFFLLALAFCIARRHSFRFPLVPAAFLACSLASSIAYYAQHTGLEFREYPQEAFLLFAIAWMVLESARTAGWKIDATFFVSTPVFALIFLLPLIILGPVFAKFEPLSWRVPNAVFAQYPPQTHVWIISTSTEAAPAVMRRHLIWGSRLECLWMLPAIIKNERAEAGGPAPRKILPPDTVKRLAALLRAQTTEDLQQWKPAVVLVRQCHKSDPWAWTCWGFKNADFDPLPWFLESPAFAAEWAHYRLQETRGNFDVYTRIP
jgi:hypothetical protein